VDRESPHQEDAMSRSLSFVRRGILSAGVAGVLGFGATQALASPRSAADVKYCPTDGENSYYSTYCGSGCPGGVGYCTIGGVCRCGYYPEP
jgi:hypothetical protein